MSRAYSRIVFTTLSVIFVIALAGCSGDDDEKEGGQSCTEGEVGCPCFDDDTCTVGLSCVDGTCVDPNAPPDAGGGGGEADASVEPPDCVDLLPLRLWKNDRSAVAMLFTAEDCTTGEAFTDFNEGAFRIAEDGAALSSEAVPRILPSQGLRVYVTLMLDMSGSTAPNLAELQAGARRFVDEILIEQGLDNVYIGLQAFDGSQAPIVLERPTKDADQLKARIDALVDFDGPDAGSTNLNGAVRQGVQEMQHHQQSVMELNYDGVVTSGYFVLFTDGGDTAGREEPEGAKEAVTAARIFDAEAGAQPTVRTIAVGLKGQDYDPQALSDLVGGNQFVAEADLAELGETFGRVGRQIARRIQGTYLLAYCSASRAGDHRVTLEVDQQESNQLSFEFNADRFAGGCSAEFFEEACDTRSCGGFNCGACDDATEICDGPDSGQCVDACLGQDMCSGEQITNQLGYQQTCDFGDEVTYCSGRCIDTSADDSNCGACGNACRAEGSQCVDGQCTCENGGLACGYECVDETSDSNNCGMCGNVCPAGVTCTEGVCDCGGGEIACGGTCLDPQTSNAHCGACGNRCAYGAVCTDGTCVCENGGTACDGECVDVDSNSRHCGGCGIDCGYGGQCVAGSCECAEGMQMCDGGCIEVQYNDQHCGQCGNACGSGGYCDGGVCRSATQDGSLRIQGGGSEGLLQVYYSGEWGTICDDNFGQEEASVACRQLGYGSGHMIDAQGSGIIWMDDVSCAGYESSLAECTFPGWGYNNCSHDEDVGVACY